MTTLTATYSPEDNKLRLYASSRLDAELYARVRAAGFIWAPKQELFVAPMWTPDRADLFVELCGEIEDEDASLRERAEDRADRFEGYSESRASDAESARRAVAAIADHIPFGQPILRGHHSERHARKDAERIENGMRKAVKNWETSEYWAHRAKRAIAHAKYKERADVRQRRIKKLEADKRRHERTIAEAAPRLSAWQLEGLTMDQALRLANSSYYSQCFPLADYPRQAPASQYEGQMGLWSALDGGVITVEQARAICLKTYPATIAWAQRWVQHFENRVAYERAMLDEQGGTVADKSKPEKGGAVQCWASVRCGWSYVQKVNRVSITLLDNWGNGGPNFSRTIEFDKLRAIMSAAEVEAARAAGVLYETEDKTGFILNKTPATPETRDERHTREHHEHVAAATPEASAETKAADFCAMREALKVGVQVVVAPQLFPTPPDLAARMVELANIKTGQRVCEPESGTNNIVRAIASAIDLQAIELVAIELHPALSASTALNFSAVTVRCADFLQCSAADIGTFDRIVMNPPLANAADIDHIAHALSLLNDGGQLVAICANGPRQNAKLRPLIEQHGGTWEVLPAGTFEDSGTGVHAVLITVSL